MSLRTIPRTGRSAVGEELHVRAPSTPLLHGKALARSALPGLGVAARRLVRGGQASRRRARRRSRLRRWRRSPRCRFAIRRGPGLNRGIFLLSGGRHRHWPGPRKGRQINRTSSWDLLSGCRSRTVCRCVIRLLALGQGTASEPGLRQLARVAARQARVEVDRTRTLEARRMVAVEGDELLGEIGPGIDYETGWTTALTSSPRSSLGTPNTATSATFEWAIKTSSTSCG